MTPARPRRIESLPVSPDHLPAQRLDLQRDSADQSGIVLAALEHDVFGQPLRRPLRWGVGLSDRTLFFAAQWSGETEPADAIKESFAEGLWEFDCAELFLSNPANGRYLEFNLSPRGAWWSCLFIAPRQRAEGWPAPLQGTRISVYEPRQLAVMALPLAKVRAALGLDATPDARLHGNVTACTGTPQQFASVAELGEEQPDFHLPQDFLPLRLS